MPNSTLPAETAQNDLRTSWAPWIHLAMSVGDEGLAESLVQAAPSDGLDPAERAIMLARSAVLAGRPEDAIDRERGADLGAPQLAEPLDVVTAAARAAIVPDDADYRWLLAHVAHVRGTPRAVLGLRLLAAAADRRNDKTTADDAWLMLATEADLQTPESLARLATTMIARRDSHASAEELTALAIHAATIGLTLPSSDHPDLQPAVDAALALVERGDAAGAALLLRALRSMDTATDGAAMDAALTQVVPAQLRRQFVLKHVGATLGGAALGLGFVLVDVRAWLLVPALAITGWATWGYFARMGPLRSVERRAWGALTRLRINLKTGLPREGDRKAAVAAALIFAFGWGTAVSTMVSKWTTDHLDPSPTWLVPALWLVLLPAPAVLLLIGLWKLLPALERRADRTRVAVEHRQARTDAAQCSCWATMSIRGRTAAYYLEGHLSAVPVDGTSRATLDRVRLGTTIAWCPVIGVPWLIAPTATDDLLLLKGAMRPFEAATPPVSDGFYL